MRTQLRATALATLLTSTVPGVVYADGLVERVVGLAEDWGERSPVIKTVGGVAMAINAKQIYDNSKKLQTFNQIKSQRVPTKAEIDEAASAVDMLGAVGGAEGSALAQPVGEVAKGWGYRTADTARAMAANSPEELSKALQQVDETTFTLSHNIKDVSTSTSMVEDLVPGKAGEMVSVGDYLLGQAMSLYDWYNNRHAAPSPAAKAPSSGQSKEQPKPTCGSMDYYGTVGGEGCSSVPDAPPPPAQTGISTWKIVSQKVNYSNPDPVDDDCYLAAPDDIKGFATAHATLFMQDMKQGMGAHGSCTAETGQNDGVSAKFIYRCSVGNQTIVGGILYQPSGTGFLVHRIESNNGIDEASQFEKCSQ